MAKVKKATNAAPEKSQAMTDEQFREILAKKIDEAARMHDWIHEWSNPLILSTGFVHFDPPRFEKFSPEDQIRFQGSPDEWGNEAKIRAYFDDNAGASLADYLRDIDGVRNPEYEAALILAAARKGRQGEARFLPGREMLDYTRGRTSWVQHWRLRGPDHLYQTFVIAFALDASIFAETCISSLEEVKRLHIQDDILALNEIQSVMLRALWAHREETHGEVRRRVEEAIQALKESLGKVEAAAVLILPTIDEIIESGDTPEERIRFAGLALLNEGRILAIGEDRQDTLSWRQLLKKWPIKPVKDNPYTLGELLAEMYRQDDDITLKAIRGNCDREAVNGGPEKDAWEDFMKEALRLVRQWQAGPDAPTQELNETITSLHKALGIEDKSIDESLMATLHEQIDDLKKSLLEAAIPVGASYSTRFKENVNDTEIENEENEENESEYEDVIPQGNKAWSEEEIDQLKKLRESHMTWGKIAIKLNRTRDSITSKARQLGIQYKR